MNNIQLIESLEYHLDLIESNYTVQDVMDAADRAGHSWFMKRYYSNKPKTNSEREFEKMKQHRADTKYQSYKNAVKNPDRVSMAVVREQARKSIPELEKRLDILIRIANKQIAINNGPFGNNDAVDQAISANEKLKTARLLAGESLDRYPNRGDLFVYKVPTGHVTSKNDVVFNLVVGRTKEEIHRALREAGLK